MKFTVQRFSIIAMMVVCLGMTLQAAPEKISFTDDQVQKMSKDDIQKLTKDQIQALTPSQLLIVLPNFITTNTWCPDGSSSKSTTRTCITKHKNTSTGVTPSAPQASVITPTQKAGMNKIQKNNITNITKDKMLKMTKDQLLAVPYEEYSQFSDYEVHAYLYALTHNN